MNDPNPLSAAAEAVEEAAYQAWVTRDDPRSIAAAALRAAADQVVPVPEGDCLHDCCAGIIEQVRGEFLFIAAELEVQP